MTTLDLTLEADATSAVNVTTDGEYSHNPAHVDEGFGHLIDFFRVDCPRNQVVMDAVMAQVQELEDAFWQLLTAFDLDTATDDQLLLLGKLVGEGQLGRADEDFRAAIRARILVNRSEGKVGQLYAIGAALIPDEDVLHCITQYDGSLAYEFRGDLAAFTLSNIARLLKKAKAGGVRIDTVFVQEDVDDTGLIWAEADEEDLFRGWGPAPLITHQGGDWSSVG